MQAAQTIDVAGHLPSDLATRSDLWPAGPQRAGALMTPYGLGVFSSHSVYQRPTVLSVCDSEHRLHLSVWLRDDVDVESNGRAFAIRGRDTVAGYLPGVPWHTRFDGYAHHVGLLLPPELLCRLGGDEAAGFLDRLRHAGNLLVTPGHADVLRAAHELDAVLFDPDTSPLLREAKSLELLARVISAGSTEEPGGLGRLDRERLRQARELLLADLSRAPTTEQLARATGLNTFKLKQGFKQLFGLSIYALYQQERMRVAHALIAAGQMSVTEAGDHVGYTNMSHFGIAFKKAHGMLPSEVKRHRRI